MCIQFLLCPSHRFLNQYKGVYERDVKCQVKMSHNSGIVGQGPPSPSKDEVSTVLLTLCGLILQLIELTWLHLTLSDEFLLLMMKLI